MEEELLKEYVGTYLNPKYNGDWDLINSKFPELSGVDKELLKEYVGTYLNPKYNSDWSVVNSKFPELFPAGKAGVESPMAIKPTADEQKKNRSSVSPFVDGGSELTKFDPRSGQVVQETREFATAKPEVKVPEQKLPERTEFQFQPGKPLPAQKTAPLPKFVEEQLTAVKPELIGKTEENVVPQLKYQFGPLGFKFEETRAGDYMMATSPSGESIYVPLDITNAADREVEANKLNAFLRKGATTVKNLSTLQKQYTDANKKIVSQKELDESLASINAEEAKVMARNAEFVKLQSSLESERTRLEIVPPQQRNNPEYIARVNDFISRADQFTNEFQAFAKDAEDLSKRGQQLNKSIGKYTEMKAEQGTWYGAGLNAFANKSYYNMAKGFTGLTIDLLGEFLPKEALMSQDDYEKNFIDQAKKAGIAIPEGEDFAELTSKMDAETIARIENKVRDLSKKIVKGDMMESLGVTSDMMMKASGVSPEYYKSIENNFVGGALLGTLSSIPAMAGGPLTRTVLMGSQILGGIDEEMSNDPAFADISENEKYLVKGPISVAVALLEKAGLSNLLNQKGFLNGLVLKALGKASAGASYKTLGELISNEIDNVAARGALTLGAGFLAEAETGALQEVADITAKEIYNMAKEKKMFDTPDSVVQFIEQVGKAGLQEGIGAGVLAVPGSVSAAYRGKGFLGMDDTQFAMFEKMANDSNIEKGFVARLKSKINSGEITTAEGKDILNNYRNSVGLFNSLPENLDMQGKKEAMNLLKEKRDLERQIDGKDQALTVPQRNRVNEINQQLTKLSEDAIQKQAAGQVPVQPGARGSQEVAQGEPQAEPQGIAQEGQEKINDIESRRQEELSNYDEEGLNEAYAVGSDQTVGEFINSKYDTELASLEQSAQQLDLDGEVSLLEQLLAQEETAPTVSAGISISSDTDIEELRNRTQSRSQQATTQEEKESANTRVKIIDTAKKAINTLKSIFPDVDIVIHDDEGSYNAAMSEIDGVAGSRGNFFIDTTPDGKTTGRIDINLSKANSRTVSHEIAHGILLKTFGDNATLFNDFRTRISKVLKGDVNKQLNDFANQYVDPTTGELLDVNHEEFLAELTGILEQQEANLSVTTMQKVAALINEFVSKITGGKFTPFEDTKNTKDVVDFFNTISGAIREGQGLEGVTEKINANAEPTGTKVDTSSLKKRSSLIEKLGLERFSDMNQRITEGITLKNLGDITSHLTFADRLVTGKVGNKDYLGGILFAAATNRVWASFTKGRVSQIINGMPKNEDGYRYLMPALLTEGAHMSNKDMSNTAIKLVEDAISNGDISPVDSDSRIRKALNRKGLENFSKLYSDTIGDNNLTPELIISAIDNAIVKSNSKFEDRNTFLESLLGKADINLKKRFGTLPSYGALANGLAEPITNSHEFGDILLVIRTKGNLVAVEPKEGDPDYHPSYPWVIRSINPDGSIADVETLIFDQSYSAVNVFPEVTNKKGQKFTYQKYVDTYGDKAKATYLGYMGARSKMSTSVTEKIATEAQPKSRVISRSQINDALSKASGSTQVATTKGSYRKAANILKNIGVDGDVLDYGAGLGLGTDAMSEVLDKPVDSLEINPERWKGIRPVKYTDANQIDKKYDGIVSLNVVNVVPKEVRDFIVLDIFNNLKEGGTAIISSRGFKGDIDGAKNFVDGGEEKSYIIKKREKGKFIYVFQKGYDGNELFEYVQGLLGDSALVVPNNTFGKRGVVITKLSNVKSRSQLAGNDAQKIVNIGRANGLSEQAISNVLEKRGFTQEAIDAALGKAEPAAKKVEVTEEFAPGYDRMITELEGVVDKSLKRGTTQARAMENAINYLQGTKVYENATDVQREQMVRDVNKRFKKRQKSAPSAEKVVGKPKKKEVTVDEMAALKDQIKLEARAAREAKGDLNDKRKALAAKVSALKGKGTVTVNQLDTIIKRIERTNLDNPIMVDRLLAYIEKVFDNANYAADMDELRKLQRQARSRNHASMTNVVKQFTSINPENIPLDRIQEYKKALDFLNNLTPSYATMNEILDEMLSYQVTEEFDAVKTLEALEKKYESIQLNEVGSVEEYRNLIKDINSFKRKAFQLLQNEEITQEQYDDLIKMVGKDQQTIEEDYKDEITKIKKDLIAEIKNQRPKVSRDFSNVENDLIRKYLELSDADLESLSPEELFILNDLLENISNGEIDVSRFGPIVSKAYTSSGLDPLAKQINKSKFDKNSEEGRQALSEQESSFWEGLLGMGRAKVGALQKLIISPFNRAISSYEKLNREGYNEFLRLKNKYKIDKFDPLKNSKDMHKIGMLTTYLQEHMAQFDSKNKDVKDIGKRDWFKEILNSRAMRDNYSSGKPSVFKSIGLGKSELDIIKEIWDSLPKDKDGNVDPKAVYDSYMANDGKFFTKNQKAFFDDVMAYKAAEITPKQKFANELSGASFKEIPFHMMRVRLDKGKSQIAPTASSENNNVRISAGTGKERVSEKVGAVMTNFEKLFISGIEQTGRDYFLSNALQDINNTLAGVKKIVGDSKIELINTISYTLSDALKFEFDRVKTNFIFRNLLSARAAQTLLRPIRTAVELGSTLISYPVRAKTLSGYKSLFGEQGAMKKLLEFTDSPMLLRNNISKAIDINDGSIEPQSAFTKATNYLSGLPERTMMVTSWMPTFKSEFKNITGIDFDMNKFNNSEAYREKYGKAIRESSAAADAQTEKIIGPTTKAGQRREVRIAPKFLANLVGSEGTVSKNTAEGQILGFFSNYPFRESTEFLNGFREAAEVLNDEGALSSLSQLQKPLGVALNVAAYSFLSSATYALGLILLGDDEDEKRGEDLLKSLLTGEGLLEELKSNAISLAGSQYAAGGKAIIQLAVTILIESTDDEKLKAKYKKLLKDSVFIDPLPVDKALGFKGEEEVAGAIGKYIPPFIIAYARYTDLIGTKNELKYIYDKVESKGVDALTEDEGLKILALNTAFNSAQLVLNVFGGTSLPEYNNIKTYMKKLKQDAGVAEVYKGEAPAKKKSSSGGGGGRAKTINKADLKKYFPELSKQIESATGEVEQEVKAFEKEQREFKKSIKDQVYGN